MDMTPALRLLLCLIISACAWAAPPDKTPREYAYAAAPAWVTSVDYKRDATVAESPSMVTLLTDDQIRISPPYTEYRRRVFKPLTTVGVEEVSELKLRFNPAFETLNIHRIVIHRDADVRDVTRSARMRVVHREEQLNEGIHDGEATALIILEDIRSGDIIDYSYSVSGSNPIFGQKQFGYVALNSGLPIDRLHIRLLAPASAPLKMQAYNNPQLEIDRRSLADNLQEYSVNLQQVMPPEVEDNMPVWYSPYSWLEFSQYGDWSEVDRWAVNLYNAEARKQSPLFDRLYARLAAASASPEDFITRALFAVQNEVRYLGLEFGENSHRPRPPEEVLKNRYGDCKDKALLLSKLLQKHGLRAWPALVSTRFQKGIADEVASPGVFDHVITLVEHQGRQYWLDGTRRYQAGTLADLGRQDLGYALVIGDAGDGLTKMYDTLPAQPTLRIEEHYYADDFKGPVRLESITTFMGNSAEAQREYFNNRPMSEIRKSWANFNSQYHDELSVLKPLEFEDDPAGNRFIVREYYQLGDFWKEESGQDKTVIRAPFVLSAYTDALRAPNTMDRKTPVQLPSPRTIHTRIYLHLPTDLNLKFDGAPLVMEDKAFRFSSIDRYYDRTYYSQTELQIKSPEVLPPDFPAFQKAVRETRKQLDFNIFFPKPADHGYTEVQTLKKQLRGWGK